MRPAAETPGSPAAGRPETDRPHSSASSLSRYRRCLREQDRAQLAASVERRLIGRAPRFEELHQLFARLVVVPFAVALDDLDQMAGRLLTLAGRIERDREIEAGL